MLTPTPVGPAHETPMSARTPALARVARIVAAPVAATLLLTCLACSGSDGGASRHPEPSWDHADPDLPARLDDALARWVADHGTIGAAATVLTPGWLDWSGATGLLDPRSRAPFPVDQAERVGSATKAFTATVILQLRDEGKLSLDTRLAEFVPDYPNAGAITVEHLLRHRSGIPEVQLSDGFFIATVLLDDTHWFTPEELLDWSTLPIPELDVPSGTLVPRKPVTFPGGDYHYAQDNFIALGLIAERITGKALAQVYDERILGPLGLEHTHLPREDDPLGPVGFTNLFGFLPFRLPTDALIESANSFDSAAWSAGGMMSSAHDLATFLAGLLDGRLHSAQSLADTMDWLPIDPADPRGGGDYGLGFDRLFRDDLTEIGHNGAVPGNTSFMKYVPELDVFVGAVTNSDPEGGEDAPDLAQRVARALRDQPQD